MTEHQDSAKESIPARPQKMQLKLSEKELHTGTDVVSFKFARRSEDNNQNQKDHHYYLNYKAGQYAIVDLEPRRIRKDLGGFLQQLLLLQKLSS